eukprot:g25588.t1
MRRLVISGGPYSIYLPQHERRQRVREIEILEDMMLSATEEIEPDMTEISALEARQEKHIQQALNTVRKRKRPRLNRCLPSL